MYVCSIYHITMIKIAYELRKTQINDTLYPYCKVMYTFLRYTSYTFIHVDLYIYDKIDLVTLSKRRKIKKNLFLKKINKVYVGMRVCAGLVLIGTSQHKYPDLFIIHLCV